MEQPKFLGGDPVSAVPETDRAGEYEPMEMNVADHIAEASRLMQGPDPDIDDYETARADNLRTAQAHLSFASVLLAATSKWNRPPRERYGVTGDRIAAGAAKYSDSGDGE